ncbi:hypothetical protein X777_16112 [Ooceraea biroi]|uniref:Uncharacterized protein n=1 Tax=Ooceraea biroi TaxID=2015173 RepID=A0A026WXN7_OOCBI|nr:hypothetical protein X777_16112 [Ooceraea biroi]
MLKDHGEPGHKSDTTRGWTSKGVDGAGERARSTRETQGERRNAGSTAANMRERHNMKTLSAVSRKAHSNVLSLAAAPARSNAISHPRWQCHVRTSGFQVGTCPPDSHGPKAPPGTGVREAPEPICERNGRGIGCKRFGAAFRPKSTTDPPEER